jgi:protein TonB
MTRDGRIAAVTLAASIGLHVGLLAAVPLLWHETPLPVHKLTTRYVVRMQQPVSAPAPSMTPPVPEPVQPVSPLQPMARVDPHQPRQLQSPQQRQPMEPLQEIPVRPIEPRELPLPKPTQPRKPMRQQRPTPVVRPQSLPPVASATPQAVAPADLPMATPPPPMQPTSEGQQAIATPQRQNGPEAKDVIQAYLAQVFAALERHKYYPATARRRGLSGRVVLQFVILPDGQVVNPQITEQNGSSPFGEAALTALRRASPLPAFPPNLRQSRLLVEVPIIYNLTGGR